MFRRPGESVLARDCKFEKLNCDVLNGLGLYVEGPGNCFVSVAHARCTPLVRNTSTKDCSPVTYFHSGTNLYKEEVFLFTEIL